MLIFLLQLSLSLSHDCSQPNLSAGHFNITSEKHLKDTIKKEKLFIFAVSAK